MFGFGPKIDVNRIRNEVESGVALLIDVRSDDEWKSGHASGATHISVDRISRGEVPTKDTSKKVYAYCASGGRSDIATRILRQRGYDVENIGGLSGWQSAGGLLE
ncbi:MAG: rhodanese-like domain-containing protein [Minisyncoccota bacterium]